MKVDLRKLPKEQKEFCVEYKNTDEFAKFCGVCSKDGAFLVADGNIKGKIEVICDVSGETFLDDFAENVRIKVIEGSYKGFDEEYDIIESDSNIFDFEAFLKDEIEIFKNDYHKKEELKDSEFVFENL